MAGGSNYRQWYAARARMIRAGTWRGRVDPNEQQPDDPDEPPAKEPRLSESGTATPDSLPALEDPPTEEGNHGIRGTCWVRCTAMGAT